MDFLRAKKEISKPWNWIDKEKGTGTFLCNDGKIERWNDGRRERSAAVMRCSGHNNIAECKVQNEKRKREEKNFGEDRR